MRRKGVIAVAAAVTALGAGAGATAAIGQGGSTDRALFGVLRGANEIGEDGRRGAGDRNGRGSATATIAGGQLCFGLTVRGIDDPVAAHIHRGRRNENGPIVVTLSPPPNGEHGAASGCVEDVSRSLAREILRRPARFYWNVHTRAYPAGAVRGQVFAQRR